MKRKMLTGTVLALFLLAAGTLYQNRHTIALKMNTDSEVMIAFNRISVGDTADDVIVKMGEPIGTIEVDGENTQYMKWPRYKGTTFAVKLSNGVVVEKYDRFGS